MSPEMQIKIVRWLKKMFPGKYISIDVEYNSYSYGNEEMVFILHIQGVFHGQFSTFLALSDKLNELSRRSEIVVGKYDTVEQLLERGGL